jgi:hypothetical protein
VLIVGDFGASIGVLVVRDFMALEYLVVAIVKGSREVIGSNGSFP